MLRVFYRRGLVRNNETGHEAGTCSLSLHSCDVFLCWMEKIYNTKNGCDGLFKKSSKITLPHTRMILTLDSKIEFQCPTWHGSCYRRIALRATRAKCPAGSIGWQTAVSFFHMEVSHDTPKKVNAGWRTLATKWQKIQLHYIILIFFSRRNSPQQNFRSFVFCRRWQKIVFPAFKSLLPMRFIQHFS